MTKSSETGKETAVRLQPMLVNLIILDLEAKQLHWNVTGALFRPLHEMFDEFVEAYRGWYDEVAERIRALDAPADGRATTVAAAAKSGEVTAGLIRDSEVIQVFLKRVETVAAGMRDQLEYLGERDLVTQDMVLGIVEGLEKQAWMLRAQLS